MANHDPEAFEAAGRAIGFPGSGSTRGPDSSTSTSGRCEEENLLGGLRGCGVRCGRVAPEAEGSEAGGGDEEQHAAAVVEVAPDRVQRRVGICGRLDGSLLDQSTGKQRGNHLGRGPAAERGGQWQQVAVRAPRRGSELSEYSSLLPAMRIHATHEGCAATNATCRSCVRSRYERPLVVRGCDVLWLLVALGQTWRVPSVARGHFLATGGKTTPRRSGSRWRGPCGTQRRPARGRGQPRRTRGPPVAPFARRPGQGCSSVRGTKARPAARAIGLRGSGPVRRR
jgi:hypothetical protein